MRNWYKQSGFIQFMLGGEAVHNPDFVATGGYATLMFCWAMSAIVILCAYVIIKY
jgi:hypothetical protein